MVGNGNDVDVGGGQGSHIDSRDIEMTYAMNKFLRTGDEEELLYYTQDRVNATRRFAAISAAVVGGDGSDAAHLAATERLAMPERIDMACHYAVR